MYAITDQMDESPLTYVFGPVPSRRLGRSLGIDLVPFKTCTYDCIYCQLGRTTKKTMMREEYVPLHEVLSEIERALDRVPAPDYLTLSGSGEPTLYSRLEELIAAVKKRYDIPLAVLTNGSLLWDRRVQDALCGADLVLPSLDAGRDSLFRYVNRPHPELSFKKMIDGLLEFRQRFSKPMWLEVLLLAGVTAIDSEVRRIAAIVKRIGPDRVQLNTVTRPPAEEYAYPASRDALTRFAAIFQVPAEAIASFHETVKPGDFTTTRENILSLVRRRPCSFRDITEGLHIHPNEAIKHLDYLMNAGLVYTRSRGDHVFYAAR